MPDDKDRRHPSTAEVTIPMAGIRRCLGFPDDVEITGVSFRTADDPAHLTFRIEGKGLPDMVMGLPMWLPVYGPLSRTGMQRMQLRMIE